VALATGSEDIDLVGDAQNELGEVLHRTGRVDEAGPPLREALALYERKGNLVSAERVRSRLAELASG
jgi:Flp pilus assembly protein TadD